jgi:hypothetical protein
MRYTVYRRYDPRSGGCGGGGGGRRQGPEGSWTVPRDFWYRCAPPSPPAAAASESRPTPSQHAACSQDTVYIPSRLRPLAVASAASESRRRRLTRGVGAGRQVRVQDGPDPRPSHRVRAHPSRRSVARGPAHARVRSFSRMSRAATGRVRPCSHTPCTRRLRPCVHTPSTSMRPYTVYVHASIHRLRPCVLRRFRPFTSVHSSIGL